MNDKLILMLVISVFYFSVVGIFYFLGRKVIKLEQDIWRDLDEVDRV